MRASTQAVRSAKTFGKCNFILKKKHYFCNDKTQTMGRGKSTCKVLKEVRREIARANGIPLEERKCTFTGDCAGTCPYCEAEVHYLEREIAKRKSLGKAVAVAGIAVAAVTMTSCATSKAASTTSDNNPPKTSEEEISWDDFEMGEVVRVRKHLSKGEKSNKKKAEKQQKCNTYQMRDIVPMVVDTAKTDSNDNVRIDTATNESTLPVYQIVGTSSRPLLVHDVWRFPSEYGNLKSYLHNELKKNPELRVWLKEKAKQKRLKKKQERLKLKSDPIARMIARDQRRQDPFKPKDNYVVLSFNQEGEVVNAYLRYELRGEEDERMSEAFFHIVENMPRWTLNPWESRPNGLVSQHYPYRYLR